MRILKKVFKTLRGMFRRRKKRRKARKFKPVARGRKKSPKPARRRKKTSPKKKAVPRPPPKPVLKAPPSREVPVGEITHYFSRIMVCVVKMSGPLNIGDNIHIKGSSTDFSQAVKSLQVESVDVKSARKGQLVGLKVKKPAREGDRVYKVSSGK